MLKNYIKIAYRSLIREKTHSLTNIVGLTVGIASCLLILLFISHELSYDKYHEKADRIYQLYIAASFGNNEIQSAVTAAPIKNTLELEVAEVEHATRLLNITRPIIRSKENSYIAEDFYYADSNFFETFTVPFIEGNPQTALAKPNTMVINQEMARKYFGNANPIGRVLKVNQHEIEITGVTEKMPSNSHFQYNFLASLTTLRVNTWDSWLTSNLFTYVVLKPGVKPEHLQEKFHQIVYKHVGPEVQQIMGIDIDSFEEMGNTYGFFLEPITDIHLHSTLDNQHNPGGNIAYVYFFSTIALFILLIACINFMNMATAKYTNRLKEVGIRKVLGSRKSQLIMQFLIESIIISLAAVILAMTVVELVLPLFNNLAGKEMELSYFNNWIALPALLTFGIIVGVLAGSYPAFFLSSFKPITILKGKAGSNVSGSKLRGTLVVVQFAITIALFVGTFVVKDQLSFFKNQNLGFEKDGIIVLKRTHTLGENHEVFREELLKNPNLINASYCSAIPGYDFDGTTTSIEGKPSEEMITVGVVNADNHFLETMGIELSQGRFYNEAYSNDSKSIIINQRLADIGGLENPLQERLMLPNIENNQLYPAKVIGVVTDINFESLHREVRPMIYTKLEGAGWLMAIRLQNENISEAINHIKNLWNEFAPNEPFIYSFLNSDLEQLYTEEERTSKIFTIFSILAILIASLGLFGMASFTAEKKTKEIGIRKVLGATEHSIFMMLSKQVIILVIFAAIIAWPIAWFVMKGWLENFANRIVICPWVFIISTIAAFIIAIITISYQGVKAAIANPVDSLKYE